MTDIEKRIIIIVLDGVGIGDMPDAGEYGDEGSDTLGNTARVLRGIDLPNLQRMGLGNLASIEGVPPRPDCTASFGVMHELSKGEGYHHRALGDGGDHLLEPCGFRYQIRPSK